MKMQTATKQEHLEDIARKIRGLAGYLPVVVTVTEGKRIRTTAQNARYWADMDHFLGEIAEAISRISEETGYTEAETRWVVAEFLPVEQRGILFALSAEAAHDCMKQICGIPTSTRLGTKAFMKFEERLAQTMTEILGHINAVVQKAAA